MWLPQGGALKIENLQFTQYSIIVLLSSMHAVTAYNYSLFTLTSNSLLYADLASIVVKVLSRC